MTVLLDSKDNVDLAQTHIEAVCLGGFSGCVFSKYYIWHEFGRKISASVKQYMVASGSIVERYTVIYLREIEKDKFSLIQTLW